MVWEWCVRFRGKLTTDGPCPYGTYHGTIASNGRDGLAAIWPAFDDAASRHTAAITASPHDAILADDVIPLASATIIAAAADAATAVPVTLLAALIWDGN